MDEPVTVELVNILLVDDEPDALLALEAVLQGLGQKIVKAQSGREALRHLLAVEFAVVLLDVQMPDMDGFETAELIRQREKTRHTPIIFLTGAESETQLVRGYTAGAVDYLVKPIIPEILKSKVSVFVELARRTQIIERQALLLRQSHEATLNLAEIRARLLKDLEATVMLAASLDFQTTLQQVADLAVSRLGDWCVIDMLEDEGRILRMAAKHRDPAKAPLIKRLHELPVDHDSSHPHAIALRTGRSALLADVTDELLEAKCRNPEELSLFKALGTRTALGVPFLARGRSLGAMMLVRGARAQEYGSADVAFAEEFAGRAAIAIDNARLYREAQLAISLRENFLNVASHELRTPLTSMRLQVDGLIRELRKAAPEQTVQPVIPKVEVVRQQTNRLERLISELLDASRISSGRFELEWEDVDLAQVVREVCERAQSELASGDAPVTFRAGSPVLGRWDRSRLEQVVTNLLANAVKYGAGKPIEVCAEGSADVARLVVRDHGIGIAIEDRERVFERFERAASEQHYGGFGLGLWIARQIVESMKGKIFVESKVGAGSSFIVELPRAQGTNHAQTEA